MRCGGFVVEKRPIGDRNDSGGRIDRKATGRIVVEAISDRIGRRVRIGG